MQSTYRGTLGNNNTTTQQGWYYNNLKEKITMNYSEDLRIDPDQLDVEWIEQPLLFHKYSALSAEANQFVRKCEERIKVVRSQLILDANQKGETVLGPKIKPIASNIEAYYRTHADHVAAKTALHEAQSEAEMLTNAVYAFHQRKVALENLTRLQGQNYFAGPTTPRNLSQEYKDNQRDNLREIQRNNLRKSIEVAVHKKEDTKEPSRRTLRERETSEEEDTTQKQEETSVAPRRRPRRNRSN